MSAGSEMMLHETEKNETVSRLNANLLGGRTTISLVKEVLQSAGGIEEWKDGRGKGFAIRSREEGNGGRTHEKGGEDGGDSLTLDQLPGGVYSSSLTLDQLPGGVYSSSLTLDQLPGGVYSSSLTLDRRRRPRRRIRG
ncbi:hypothetical protein ACLOJK_029274 [Asimina triloba]